MNINLKKIGIAMLSIIGSKHFANPDMDESRCMQEEECSPNYDCGDHGNECGRMRWYAMRKTLWNTIALMRAGRGGKITFTMAFKIKEAKKGIPKKHRC